MTWTGTNILAAGFFTDRRAATISEAVCVEESLACLCKIQMLQFGLIGNPTRAVITHIGLDFPPNID